MNEIFIKSIYKNIVEENKYLYKNLLENIDIDKANDEYWKQSLKLYNNLSRDDKGILMNIMQQTMIDTISNMLGIIDGNSALSECDAELKLYLNGNYTDGELQDLFLEYVEA